MQPYRRPKISTSKRTGCRASTGCTRATSPTADPGLSGWTTGSTPPSWRSPSWATTSGPAPRSGVSGDDLDRLPDVEEPGPAGGGAVPRRLRHGRERGPGAGPRGGRFLPIARRISPAVTARKPFASHRTRRMRSERAGGCFGGAGWSALRPDNVYRLDQVGDALPLGVSLRSPVNDSAARRLVSRFAGSHSRPQGSASASLAPSGEGVERRRGWSWDSPRSDNRDQQTKVTVRSADQVLSPGTPPLVRVVPGTSS
ncbi:hypothetical protein QFZ55_000118 [Streptomyces luteogriseus]|nr:hypothetical protein [Streptomyces luteogriseus]